jgi:nitroreductase
VVVIRSVRFLYVQKNHGAKNWNIKLSTNIEHICQIKKASLEGIRFRDRELHGMTIRLGGLYDIMVELEEKRVPSNRKDIIMLKQIENRRSIRKYLNKKVEQEKLIQVLESARLAPSGSNTQPWVFIVVESEEMKEKLSMADHQQKWMMTAPVFIVCVADIRCRISEEIDIRLNENSPEPELKQIIRDTSIAIEHILLEAEHLGLATCWTAWFEQNAVRPILNIPEDKYVCGIITLGYGDEVPKNRPRKKLEEMVRYEKW